MPVTLGSGVIISGLTAYDAAGNPIGPQVTSNAVPVGSQSQIGQGSFSSAETS